MLTLVLCARGGAVCAEVVSDMDGCVVVVVFLVYVGVVDVVRVQGVVMWVVLVFCCSELPVLFCCVDVVEVDGLVCVFLLVMCWAVRRVSCFSFCPNLFLAQPIAMLSAVGECVVFLSDSMVAV